MYWINIKGKFATDDPNLFLQNLKHLMQQTRTIFSGEIAQQQIIDIECEAVNITKSEQMEVLKETESNENTDDSVNEEVTEQSSPETEK